MMRKICIVILVGKFNRGLKINYEIFEECTQLALHARAACGILPEFLFLNSSGGGSIGHQLD
jgi:hypothetical protein